MKRSAGFTLIELLVVLIILGVLAAIGVPTYINVVEKSRASQAVEMLGAIKDGQARYLAEKSVYCDNANFATGALGVSNVPAGGKVYWSFQIISVNAGTSFTAAANRMGIGAGNTSNFITIDQGGNWAGAHSGVPNNPS